MQPGGGITLFRDEGRGWFSFSSPCAEFAADTLPDVNPVLEKVDALVQKGFHCVGFVSYEAAPAFDPAMMVKRACTPLAWFRCFRKRDHLECIPAAAGAYKLQRMRSGMNFRVYRAQANEIKRQLEAGSSYQVNLTFPLHYTFAGDPFDFFCQLQHNQEAGFAAYIETGALAVCSASPELFFRRTGAIIETRPMKGTARRLPDFQSDLAQKQALVSSVKNAAENVMIVDMIRNDLGKIAYPGSVAVKSLLDVEQYPTVYQCTSTVRARTNASLSDVFRALFPCASVTGAPKIETMKIIRNLELQPRGIYTGSIGFVSPDQCTFNVAIRTMVISKSTGKASYHVGSGVVWDSDPQSEYTECMDKAKTLEGRGRPFMLLETMRWSVRRGYYLLDLHLARIENSAKYFRFRLNRRMILAQLTRKAKALDCPARVRLTVDRTGKAMVEASPLPPGRNKWHVGISSQKADCTDRFLYHKTTARDFYDKVLRESPEFDDMIISNKSGEITESCKANIVAVIDGVHYTPPVKCGLLPGVMRQHLLNSGRIEERILTAEDLSSAEQVYLINSLRGKISIVLEPGRRSV